MKMTYIVGDIVRHKSSGELLSIIGTYIENRCNKQMYVMNDGWHHDEMSMQMLYDKVESIQLPAPDIKPID